ncbi:hypothetical protein LTR99_001453 [Exophiala xenobiotica]|uniref:Uncharacterized protein n=1 Tax=Vermiconidia calcicola TaxID=1690605 RepID=A0AAV9QKU9_9PEZI|nr:hypothetical protein LTR72_001135 [Exophiala xenobiotica]KAK5543963.1 hypothetical protein LTR25_001578 [Vermiconidia calcicola]KAK5549726.1 hypothetical protein LTR23_000016 [Chaetothyriales sp. CCFEE 6169]KAK5271391.1 hypothetical protein LTR96_003215 [Exophiala xenobiotica]KAK5289484.1 hypothetical protein LTR14_007122 [Exophiala xenobiotica]
MHWDERSAKVVVIQQSQAAGLPSTPDELPFSIDRPFSPGLTLLAVAWCIVFIFDLFMDTAIDTFIALRGSRYLTDWRCGGSIINWPLLSLSSSACQACCCTHGFGDDGYFVGKVRESRHGLGAAKEEDGSGDEISGERSDFDQTDEGNDVHEDQERLRNSKERLCSGRPSIVSLAQDRTVQVCTQVYHSFAPVCDLDQVHANDKRGPALFTGVTHAEHPLIYILNPSPEESIPDGPRIYVVPSGFMRKTEERRNASKTALQRDWKSATQFRSLLFSLASAVIPFGQVQETRMDTGQGCRLKQA